MGQLNGQQGEINVHSVDQLCQSDQSKSKQDFLPSIQVINSSSPPSSRKSRRSKWRPEIPKVNWQDCFCICFFVYLLFSETESEKQRKCAKKAEKEMIQRKKKILQQQEKEKKHRIKEMVKERELTYEDDEKRVKIKRKDDKKMRKIKDNDDKVMVKNVSDQLTRRLGKNVEKDEQLTNGRNNSINTTNYRIDNVQLVLGKQSINCQLSSSPPPTINSIVKNQQSNQLNKINNLDSTNLVSTHNPITVNWNDLN